jgi:hypothetical protein
MFSQVHPVFAIALVLFALSVHAKQPEPTYGVYFPKIDIPSGSGVSLLRLVVTCGRVEAITSIPEDWYVQTLRPNVQSGPEWQEFLVASSAIELRSGHGASRLSSLQPLDGLIKLSVADSSCLEIAVDVVDDLGEPWRLRLKRSQLRLRS